MPLSPQKEEPQESTEATLATALTHAAIATKYARDVVAGRIVACKWVKLACQRHLDDLVQAAINPNYKYNFDEAKAGRDCRFIEQLPHTKGDWAISLGGRDNRIKLEPWQCFIYANVFGWLHKDSGLRRFRIAYVCIPRKNGKSILAAGVGNYMFSAEGEFGAEVYAGATCMRQAMEVFRPAKQMIERKPRIKEAFGIHVGAKNLAILSNGSRFEPVVGNPGDGASPSCGIVDEYHEHRTDALVDTLSTGMGARRQPLLWIITTAGSNIAGPCYSMQRDVEKMLEGSLNRDELFGVIYTIDPEDDWTSDLALRKANPNFGVSVFGDYLLAQQNAAIQSSRKQNVFKTKNLNVWCGASTAWMNMQKWKAIADPSLSLDEFAGEPVWMGCDLSSSIDITARVLVFKRLIETVPGDADPVAHYYVFGRYYLPREKAEDPEAQHYQQWLHDRQLTGIDGPTIDLSLIRQHVLDDAGRFDVREIAFDPWAALETQQELQRELGEDKIISVPMQTKYLSYPMKQLEALTLEKRIHHDGCPVLTWMMSNVVAHEDANENVFPRKEKPENKIDGAVALILALSRALADTGPQFHKYSGF